ncbi:MAG: mechanosensitive ion channel family protein [Candidatus Pseudobacter hemicellulosilyticus]|uniref:Mechanosensitive ion channel family protein n=1 Tax=Candidatus Pseudobacter hemicellulosilyticus TaxID=3121375 RepID=A0AAJ5WTS5_9BACT|nr:MAG: mechanosensitive ion channel family protein [Pseudobacter sp.]
MEPFWEKVVWGNTLLAYMYAAGGMLLAWLVIRLLRKKVLTQVQKWIARTTNRLDDLVFSVGSRFVLPWLYLLVNYNILLQLRLSVRVDRVLAVAMAAVTMYYIVRIINHILHVSITGIMRRKGESEFRIRQLNGAMLALKALIWLIGIVFLIDNLGYNVTTFIAGLGVGGIAIALAAQTVLGDLFSYFVIFFDKPFEIGDYIAIGDKGGTIEYIGVKTTRIRSLSGEQLVLTNSDLTKLTIQNFKTLEKRREVLSLNVVYQTTEARLEAIPGMIKQIIESQELTTFDRAHLNRFGEYSINFEIVYLIQTADYNKYMDVRQAVLLAIFQRFRKEGIDFAYPTQTLYQKARAGESPVNGMVKELRPDAGDSEGIRENM